MKEIDSFSAVIQTLKTNPQGSKEYENAFREYFKHVNGNLFKYAENLCYSSTYTKSSNTVDEILQLSYVKFVKSISVLHDIKIKENEGAYSAKIVGYHRVILRNCYFDHLRDMGVKKQPITDDTIAEDSTLKPIEIEYFKISKIDQDLNLSLVKEILKNFSKRDREIIIAYAEFNAFNGEEAPEYIRKSLSREFNISLQYLTTLKGRIFNKIKEHLLTLQSGQKSVQSTPKV